MRTAAGFLIGLAGIFLGLALSDSMIKRAKMLVRIKTAFEEIRRRIVRLGQPLAQAFADASPLMLEASQLIMMGSEYPFSGSGAFSCLNSSDIDILNEQVRQMYLMDKENCDEVCKSALDRLRALSVEAETEANNRGKLMRTLCTCIGIAAAVLIV